MKKTLLVSSSGQSTAPLLELLKSEGFGPVTVTAAAFNARQETERTAFDLICINAPLADENGIDLSRHFAETTRAGVVMIVPQKNADEVNDMLTQYGVLVIAKPINRHLFHHYLQFTDPASLQFMPHDLRERTDLGGVNVGNFKGERIELVARAHRTYNRNR